jgi:hypothetical protein
MNEISDALVFWILVPLFLAVGLYLIWFARRRKEMLATFASSHQLSIKQDYEEKLQKRLDKCFALNKKNLVRSFDQLSSIIDGGLNFLILILMPSQTRRTSLESLPYSISQ